MDDWRKTLINRLKIKIVSSTFNLFSICLFISFLMTFYNELKKRYSFNFQVVILNILKLSLRRSEYFSKLKIKQSLLEIKNNHYSLSTWLLSISIGFHKKKNTVYIKFCNKK